MNGLFVLLGIEAWKPVVAALLLPPVPLLLLVLVGTRMVLWRRGLGWLVVALSVLGLWLTACTGFSDWLDATALKPPPALDADAIARLKHDAARVKTAIVILGNGRETLAPEYGLSNLGARSMERLRYGIWLGRETGAPVAFSGGTGHGQLPGASEADVASRIAAREFGRPLRWTENESRDTRENAARTLAVLQPFGIGRILLVTHGWHMPRAQRDFEQSIARERANIEVVAAPMGLAAHDELPVLKWIPSTEGFMRTRDAAHELIGLLSGA